MVTQREKDLIFTVVDMLGACVKMIETMNKTQGINEHTPFILACREAISNGYAVAHGNADKHDSKLLERNPYI